MKTDEETRDFVRNFVSNVRACMKDHGVTIAELAKLCGMTQRKLRLQLINGDLDLTVCWALYRRTERKDMRACGIDADYVPTEGTLDEAIKLLARPDADKILAEIP